MALQPENSVTVTKRLNEYYQICKHVIPSKLMLAKLKNVARYMGDNLTLLFHPTMFEYMLDDIVTILV